MDDMNTEVSDFDSWCQNSWGSTVRSYRQLLTPSTPQIQDHVDYDHISHSLKLHIAEKLIFESCYQKGSFVESGDVTWYICKFSRELRGDGNDFAGRRIQPLKAALLLTAHSQFSSAAQSSSNDFDQILAGGAAMSAMYLLAQFEYLCRKKGRYLNEDGTIKRIIPTQLRKSAGLKANFKPNTRKRVNQIDQAFRLYLYRNRMPAGKRLQILNQKLRIIERLGRIRHPVMHGKLPDPAVEAWFLALLIAMFYYGKGQSES